MPDFTSQFVHEFHCWASLAESMILEGQTERPVQQLQFHVLVCEGLVPFSNADLDGLDREETAYMMALAIAGPARLGFRIRDCGRNNWGFGFRNGRVVPLVLDGNSWTQLDSTDEAFNRFLQRSSLDLFGISPPKSMRMQLLTLRPLYTILLTDLHWIRNLFFLLCSGVSPASMPRRLGTLFDEYSFIW